MRALLALARTLALFAAVWASASAQAPIPSAPTKMVASRIIGETIASGLRQGQPDRAIVAGVDRLLSTIGGTTPAQAVTPQGDAAAPAAVPLNPFELVLIGLVILALALIAIRSPMTALFLLVNIFGRGGGGGMSGVSGFSGGGGRSGGGGASGRW